MYKKPEIAKSAVKAILAFIAGVISHTVSAQNLHLTNTINYGKYITDIVFSKAAPYSPLIYAYKIHPPQAEEDDIQQVTAQITVIPESNGNPKQIQTRYIAPPPPYEYALQNAGQKDSFNIEPNEKEIFLTGNSLITWGERRGNYFFNKYIKTGGSLSLVDSILFPANQTLEYSLPENTGKENTYITWRLAKNDSLYFEIYDTALKKVFSIVEPRSQTGAALSPIINGRFIVENYVVGQPDINLREYSLKKGKLAEINTKMPEPTNSRGIEAYLVNDTTIFLCAEAKNEKGFYMQTVNIKSKNYWSASIPERPKKVNILPASKKIICTFTTDERGSTIKFYSLSAGQYESTLDIKKTIPEIKNIEPAPLLRFSDINILTGGKWAVFIAGAYRRNPGKEPENYYLLATNGKKTIASSLQNIKESSFLSFIPLSQTEFAMVIDNSINYYSIH